MDKRILVPTDFSRNALNAVRYALDLYKDHYCEFYLLNAFQVRVYSIHNMMVPEPGDRAYEAAKKKSADQLEKLEEILELHDISHKHKVYTISSYNNLLEAIRNTIASKDIDLVVMGTKGITGSDTAVFGTNTVNIMEKVTECPVIAVPENYSFTSPRMLAFPTNYKTEFKRRELNYLLEIARTYEAKIQVVYVEKGSGLNKTQQGNKELLETILEGHNYENHVLTDVKVHEGIQAFIDDENCDMVAFVNKKHWFFGSILSNPLVKDLGYDATIPILALNDHS